MSLHLRVMIAAGLAFATAAACAAPATGKTLTPQQQRMSDCSKQSAGKKGDERKALLSACLKGQSPAATPAKPTQQEKMKTCNADAKTKGVSGDARKAFMSACLKGTPVPAK